MRLAASLFAFLPLATSAGEYSDCILENMKNVPDRKAVYLIQRACADKALPQVPAKCKRKRDAFDDFLDGMPPGRYDEKTGVDPACVAECLNASYWSRHFGECAP